MNEASPINRLQPFRKGERLEARKLNAAVEALNRGVNGVAPPQQIVKPSVEATEQLQVVCRYLLDDSAVALTGVQTVDGQATRQDDLVLRACDDVIDGVWKCNTDKPWTRVGKLSASHGTDKVRVYSPGTQITIWDGDSAPLLYVVTIALVAEV